MHHRLLPVTERAASAQELSEADRQGIQSVSDRFRQHLLAKNLDSLAMLYTDDAVIMPPNHAPVIGRSAIREFQASYPSWPISA